jgi:hypothetical protein
LLTIFISIIYLLAAKSFTRYYAGIQVLYKNLHLDRITGLTGLFLDRITGLTGLFLDRITGFAGLFLDRITGLFLDRITGLTGYR